MIHLKIEGLILQEIQYGTTDVVFRMYTFFFQQCVVIATKIILKDMFFDKMLQNGYYHLVWLLIYS